MDDQRPKPHWVYRGQSTKGIGEGPGQHVAHGDQYLDASEALREVKLLEAIRPWMTLDSTLVDHERLKDGLEAWSCFRANGWQFVARLVSAGIYDRRAAYFSQGFAWSREGSQPPGFDPGLFLGQSEAFEKPWRDRDPGRHAPDLMRVESAPAMVRPRDVEGSSQAAVSFLAHLFQACVLKCPLIIAAPVAEFAAGSPLHALVSFARGALPAGLKRDCSVRVYTRTPELFLGHLKATMVAVPEEVASQALGVRRDAILLDRSGGRLAGPAAEPPAVNYAEAVLKRALKIPEGLGLFSERFEAKVSPRGLPDPQSVRAVEPTYNLAVALAGSVEDRRDLLLSYLPKVAQWLGPGEVWSRLISPEEWAAFPPEALQALLLRDLSSAPAGARELQATVETILAGQGWRLDDRLDEWWDGADPGKVRKLVELLDRKLVTPAAVASRTSGLPLRCLPDAGVARAALAAEMSENVLSSRSSDPAGLADLAADGKIFSLLAEAVRKRALDAGWARELVRKIEDAGLVELARRFLPLPGFLLPGTWGDLPRRVVDRLCGRELPPDLGGRLFMAGKDLQPATDPGLYLRLVEALGATLPSGSENGLASRLLDHLPSEVPEEDFPRFFRILDRSMVEKPRETTRTLVESGWWYAWRVASKLDSDRLRDAALEWITCDAWAKVREAHLETWKIVLVDLPEKLDLESLCKADGTMRRRWPWIPPFEEEQLGDLARRAGDLEALAVLAESLANDQRFPGVEPIHRVILRLSGRWPGLHEDALTWLLPGKEKVRPDLGLEPTRHLLKQAGRRIRTAVDSALSHGDLSCVLDALDERSLWSDPEVRSTLGDWIGKQACIELPEAQRIDGSLGRHTGKPARYPERPRKEMTEFLRGNGLLHVLDLLSSSLRQEKEAQSLEVAVLNALQRGESEDPCWSDLATVVSKYEETEQTGVHPLLRIARLVLEIQMDDGEILIPQAWTAFEKAADRNFRLVGRDTLPAFHVAASLLGEGSLGNAARWVIFFKTSRGYRSDELWWRSLIHQIRSWSDERPCTVDDREDVAFSLVASSVKELDEPERRSFWRAFESEAKASSEWTLPREFGVKTQ